MNPWQKVWKTLLTVGAGQVVLFLIYRAGLRLGWWRRVTQNLKVDPEQVPELRGELFVIPSIDHLKSLLGVEGTDRILTLADEICQGTFRPFGGDPAPLVLDPPYPLNPWDVYQDNLAGEDIKVVWEPARLGWVFTLGRAYILSRDERYAQTCLSHLKHFLQANPPGDGPNWASGQEVALRIPALLFALQVFQSSPAWVNEDRRFLISSILTHARRILPTFIYARAQNNNHLISKALGLYLVGVLLPEWPESERWRNFGWRWLNWAFQHQITLSGCYVQNSHNYHRLMLHLALLFARAAVQEGRRLPPWTQERLSAAVSWLWERMDPWSGEVPNYGHNDGSNLLPFGSFSITDYRPTLQAAGQCFGQGRLLPSGPWDELSLWLGVEKNASPASPNIALHPGVIKPSGQSSWAMIYGSSCKGRVAHADYLHVDLWSHGVNLLMDVGTYAYNLPPPWDNGLARTLVHNTLTVDGRDQLQRLGKFLWSTDGKVQFLEQLSRPGQCWTASHDGYRRLGIVHRRSLAWLGEGRWEVIDEILPVDRKGLTQHQFDLHWLIRDGEWDFDQTQLKITYPQWGLGMRLCWSVNGNNTDFVSTTVRLIRQGKVILGPGGDFECLGWYSPTYYHRFPALSLLITWKDTAPCKIVTSIVVERSGNR